MALNGPLLFIFSSINCPIEKDPIKVKYICNNIFKYLSLKNIKSKYNPNKTALPITGKSYVSFCCIVSIPSFCLSPEIKQIFVENVQLTYTRRQVDTAVIIAGCIGINGLMKVIKSNIPIAI